MQMIYHTSVRTTIHPFGHLSPIKNSGYSIQSIQYFYGTWDFKKKQLVLVLHRKKYILVFGYSITLMHGTWKNPSHWTIAEKIYFRSRLQYYWMHRTQKIFNRHSTPPKEKLFLATVILWRTGHRNYNVWW